MGVCKACHKSKVKCDKNTPCARCVRLQMECVPHISQQGKKKKIGEGRAGKSGSEEETDHRTTKTNDGTTTTTTTTTTNSSGAGTKDDLQTETAFVKTDDFSFALSGHDEEVDIVNHYGLNHILRQWISLSFCRRTFRLLEVASGLANKYGIPMDRIICGKGMPPEWIEKEIAVGGTVVMSFLSDVVAKPAEELYEPLGNGSENWNETDTTDMSNSHTTTSTNTVPDSPLLLEEIPIDILKLMRCVEYKCTGNGKRRPCLDMGNRWIFVREMNYGTNRFFVSDGFARDIATCSKVQQTYKENDVRMLALWMPDDKERARYTQGLVHQVSLNHTPFECPPPHRVARTKIILNTGDSVTVDSVFCYRIISLDRSYASIEFIPSTQLQQRQLLEQQQQQQNTASSCRGCCPSSSNDTTSEVLHGLTLRDSNNNNQHQNSNRDDVDNDNDNNEITEDFLFGDIPEFQGQFDGFEDWLKDAFERQQNNTINNNNCNSNCGLRRTSGSSVGSSSGLNNNNDNNNTHSNNSLNNNNKRSR